MRIKITKKEMIDLQNQIFQMLAYSYMRIGDFSMAQALMKQGDVNSKSYILKIRDIEGLLKNFPLTDNLNRLSLIIDSYLNMFSLCFLGDSESENEDDGGGRTTTRCLIEDSEDEGNDEDGNVSVSEDEDEE